MLWIYLLIILPRVKFLLIGCVLVLDIYFFLLHSSEIKPTKKSQLAGHLG